MTTTDDDDFELPLVEAAERGDLGALERELAAGADPNARTLQGSSALWWAAREGHVVLVARLLGAGSVPTDDESGWFAAVPDRLPAHLAILRMLLDAGADPDARADGKPALYRAALGGDAEMVALLLERGADPNAKDDEGGTPLLAAACWGHTEAVRVLLDHGADPDAAEVPDGFTALMYAAQGAQPELAALLLFRGADAQRATSSGFTALMFAAQIGHAGIAHALLAAGADPAASTPDDHRTALDLARALAGVDPEAHLRERLRDQSGDVTVTWRTGPDGTRVLTLRRGWAEVWLCDGHMDIVTALERALAAERVEPPRGGSGDSGAGGP